MCRVAQPALQGAGDELTAVVAANVTRYPSLCHQPLHHFDEVDGGELAGDVECEALPAVFIDDREDPQLAAVVGAVADKVLTPDVVDALCPGRDGAGGFAPPPGPLHPTPDPQVALPPDALDELAPSLPAFAA